MLDALKSLSDPHRQKILKLLGSQEMSVCEIFEVIELSQPAISFHLKTLKQANLISSKKQGKNIFYTLNTEGLKVFFNQLNCFMHDLSCFSEYEPSPSVLRQNSHMRRNKVLQG